MKKMSRKSQITIFLIAGIAMILVAGVLLYIGSGVKTRKELFYSDSSPVTKYVEECLKMYSEQAIEIAGTQAGYIYQSQSGPSKDPSGIEEGKTYLSYSNIKIPYLIRRIGSDDSQYPWQDFPSTSSGTNSYIHTISASSMLTRRQLENQVETFIENRMSTGCQLSRDLASKGYIVNVISKPKATTTITEKEVYTKLTMPIEVTELSTGSRFALRQFLQSKKSSLGKIHKTARTIIDKDNQDFRFNMNEIPLIGTISITITRDAHEKDDVIILTDQKYGETFQFARQNRRPALEQITGHVNLDNIQSIQSPVRAVDPDEDLLTYSANGDMITVSDGQYTDSQSGVTIIR